MTRDEAKKIFKFVAIIYLASFFILNWNDVSWIFNYKEVSGLVEDFFNPYPSIDANAMDAYFYPNHSAPATTATVTAPKEVKTNYTDKQNTLEIAKIGISVPIVFSNSTEKTEITKDLDSGVIYYPGSVYPGQNGQIIILGHSAPPGWPKIKHDWVFTNLEKIGVGDEILIDLNNKQYTYVVKQKDIIKRGADVPTDGSTASKSILTLVSCWPPGKDYQRIAVQAELKME
ncbi:MAG: class E sortase [Candidatus Staskawiczbacteria bacterium]|nr:class E sortase [Candidatus Staskawiczbacteria bacterium]